MDTEDVGGAECESGAEASHAEHGKSGGHKK